VTGYTPPARLWPGAFSRGKGCPDWPNWAELSIKELLKLSSENRKHALMVLSLPRRHFSTSVRSLA